MAELALGVIGIVPVLGLVFKSHKSLYKKLKTFKVYSSVAKHAQQELHVQKIILENEWKILWNLAMQDEKVVFESSTDPHVNRRLDTLLRDKLGESYDACLSIIRVVQGILHGLEEELQQINNSAQSPEETSEKNSVRKFRRLQDGIKVVLNKSDWESAMQKLKDARSDLTILCKQLQRLGAQEDESHKTKTRLRVQDKTHLAEWRNSLMVKRSSKALHDTLIEAWNCSQTEHKRHFFKLFLETGQLQDETQMNLAILYDDQMPLATRPNMAHLEVRSQMIGLELVQDSPPTPPDEEAVQGPAKRLKVVRFSEATFKATSGLDLQNNDPLVVPKCLSSCDLRSSRDVCLKLTHHSHGSITSMNHGPPCLGHFDISRQEERMRLSFYSGYQEQSRVGCDPMGMHEVIGNSNKELINPVDKLRLARAVASAALKFHATPWLADIWQLQELAMFVDDIEDLSRSLWSLHVGQEFGQRCARQLELMDGVRSLYSQDTSDDERDDDEIRCNIKNRPLYSLGVALLQIDRWTSLEVGDVVKVRRTAERPSQISKRYKDLTDRCLECDFGRRCGKDLSKASLQQAVYKNVVGELDTLIRLAEEMNISDTSEDDRW